MINTWNLITLKSKCSILYSPCVAELQDKLKNSDSSGLKDYNEKIIYDKASHSSKKNKSLFSDYNTAH